MGSGPLPRRAESDDPATANGCDAASFEKASIELALPSTNGCARILVVGATPLRMDVDQALALRAGGYDREDVASAFRQVEIDTRTATQAITGWPADLMLVEGDVRVASNGHRTRGVVTNPRLSTMTVDAAMQRLPALRERIASTIDGTKLRALGTLPDEAALKIIVAKLTSSATGGDDPRKTGTIDPDALNALVRAATRSPAAVHRYEREVRAAFAALARARPDWDFSLEHCVVLDDCAAFQAAVDRRAQTGGFSPRQPGVRYAEERWYEPRPRARALTRWLATRAELGEPEKKAMAVVAAELAAAFVPLTDAPYKNATALPKMRDAAIVSTKGASKANASADADVDNAFRVLLMAEGWRTRDGVGLALKTATTSVNGMPPARPPDSVAVTAQTSLFVINLRATPARIVLKEAVENAATVELPWDGVVPPRTVLVRPVSLATKDKVRVGATSQINVAFDVDGARVEVPIAATVGIVH